VGHHRQLDGSEGVNPRILWLTRIFYDSKAIVETHRNEDALTKPNHLLQFPKYARAFIGNAGEPLNLLNPIIDPRWMFRYPDLKVNVHNCPGIAEMLLTEQYNWGRFGRN
jgi:hypothetical protein